MADFGRALRALHTAPGVSGAEVEEIAAGVMSLAEPIEIGADCTCCAGDTHCSACRTPPAEPVYMWTSLVESRQFELCAGCCAEWRHLADRFDPACGPLRIAEIDSFEGPDGARLWFPR